MRAKKAKALRAMFKHGYPELVGTVTSYVETTKGGNFLIRIDYTTTPPIPIIGKRNNTLKLSDECLRGLCQRVKRTLAHNKSTI
jgi:hypothetical protein